MKNMNVAAFFSSGMPDRVHPDVKSIPLKENDTLPFGIIYAIEAEDRLTELNYLTTFSAFWVRIFSCPSFFDFFGA